MLGRVLYNIQYHEHFWTFMYVRSHNHFRSLTILSLLSILPIGVALAQDSDDQTSEDIEEVVVLGSAIPDTPIDQAHAVTAVDRSDMEQQGSPLLVDIMKNLGPSNGVVGERQSWYNSGLPAAIPESVSNINLRGLGASRTLVLLNGIRQTYLPARLLGGRFVDLSVLPSISIQRVEILKEGASAIYGSDAIGGIANFVTRNDFEGFETAFSLDSYDGAQDSLFAAMFGRRLGYANFVVAFEHERRGELEAEDRDWVLRPLQDPWRAAWSSVGNPGYFWLPTGIDTATTPREEVISTLKMVQWGGKIDPACNELNGYPEHAAVDPYYCIFNYQPFDNLIEEINSTRIFAELNGSLESGTKYHLEFARLSSMTPQWQTQPSHPPFPLLHRGVMEIAPDHPNRVAFCADSEYSATFAEECAAGENWYWRGRPFGNGSEQRTAEREMYTTRFAGSLEGMLNWGQNADTRYDVSFSYSSTNGNVPIPAILTERLFLAFRGFGGPNCGVGVVPDTSLGPGMRVGPTTKAPGTEGCQYINPFSSSVQFSSLPGAPYHRNPNPYFDPDQTNSPELIDWLNSVSDIDSEASLFVTDVILSRPLSDTVSVAVGYQFRQFSATGSPNNHGDLSKNPCPVLGDRNCLSGNFGAFTFINAYNPYDTDQSVHRVFGEFAIKMTDSFDVQLATNYESYDVASSVDPKIAVRLEVNENFVLRGSLQTTFRTPSVDDLLEDVPLTVTQLISQVGAWIPVDIYGDADLDPEKALTYNFGVIVTPTKHMEITFDYWNYRFDDVIGSLPHDRVDELYADPETSSQVGQFIYCADGRVDQLTDPCDSRSITRVEVPLVNYPGVETSGIDWLASNSFYLGSKQINVGVSGTYTLNYDLKPLFFAGLQIQDSVEAAGKLNFGQPLLVPIPHWKTQVHATYQQSGYNFSVYMNHISSYEDDATHDGYGGVPVSSFTVDSFTTFDITTQWYFSERGIDVTVSLLNLFDQEPPFANVEHSYDGMTHNPKGRRLKMTMRYSWGR